MSRPVYVGGWGVVSPWGGVSATLRALVDGETAIRPITRFDADRFPCTVAAPVDRFLDEEDRRGPMVLAALDDLLTQHPPPKGRIGVFLGAESGRGSFGTLRRLVEAGGRPFDPATFVRQAGPLADRLSPSRVSPAAPAVALAMYLQQLDLDLSGPNETVSLACASGLAAVVEGVRAVARGQCDVALVGGVGVDVDPLMIAGFGKLQALSAHGVSRPFDRRRDGFVVGEGAALCWVSATPSAVRVLGVGRSVDAVHLTQPDPEGRGAERAMRAALMHLDPEEPLDVVVAHGTSTPLNDAVEAAALIRLGRRLGAVSSPKGAVGHWIAGAGALGLGLGFAALTSGEVVPNVGLELPDVDLPLVMGRGHYAVGARTALVNAFAFGGANVSMCLRSEP